MAGQKRRQNEKCELLIGIRDALFGGSRGVSFHFIFAGHHGIQLDTLVMDQADYKQFESLLTDVKDRCEERFRQWLIAKGLQEHAEDFAGCPFIFFDFVYGYMHDYVIVLKTVTDRYWMEFFEDFIIRKMMAALPEYILWPPALKLFYRFLHEKGYLNNPDKIIRRIDKIEPYFIEVLKHQFS